MALALYRKYRPATFAEVVGQDHVTQPLRTALAAKRINHAYLFSGPRGCGKTSSARILARSLNCAQGPTPDPCGICDSCVALAPEGSGSIDVVELDAASHGGVDDARELRDKAFYAPAESRYRVFIIDEAHMVTTQGFNALLKIVEEPPEHLVFIFATTEPDKVLATIRSRTHHYPFRLVPPGVMRSLLERNCSAEGVSVEPTVFPLVIRAGGGSVRDTQSVLDQLLAGAGAQGVTYERAVALLGVTDVGLIDDIVDGLAAGDGPAVFGTIDRVIEAGHDPRRFATDLLERLRDLVLLLAVPDAAARGLVAMPADELTRMNAQAQRFGPATLLRHAEILHNGLIEMRGATAPRLLVELLCARMLLPAASATDAAVMQRLEGLERRMTLAPAVPVVTPQLPATTSRPQPAPAQTQIVQQPSSSNPVPTEAQQPSKPAESMENTAPRGIDSTAVRQVWPELLSRVGQRSKPVMGMLAGATVKAVEGNTLVLATPLPSMARQLGLESRTELIRAVLGELFAGEWNLRLESGAVVPAVDATKQRPVATQPDRPRPPAPAVTPPPSPADQEIPPPAEPAMEEEYPPEPDQIDEPESPQERSIPVPKPEPDVAAIALLTEELGARRIDQD